jgi:hypothetical protein
MNSDHEHGAERAKQVFDKELQIVRQRELLAKLEHNDGSAAALHRARTVLAELELNLVDLNGNYPLEGRQLRSWDLSGVKSAVSASTSIVRPRSDNVPKRNRN